jgi:glutamate/tyrosine decarboxylase-like PLP-dependent enzyme
MRLPSKPDPQREEWPPASSVTLDPANWDAFARTVHQVADQAIAYLRDVRARPVWTQVPACVRQAFTQPLPVEPEALEAISREAVERILPYATGNIHPRFFGWVHGAGMANGLVAEILAAAMNSNVGGRDHGAVYVERQVVDWCRQLFGFDPQSSGILLSGTSMANLVALTVARNRYAGAQVRETGLWSKAAPLTGYTSAEAHHSVSKAFEMLGLGSSQLRRIPVDGACRIDLAVLEKAIEADRHGFQPFCIIGTAGTVNTGAIDDLLGLAAICRRHGLWFHVDGAFGALAILSDHHRNRLLGIEQADSIAFDFHKWMHVTYDAGCVLIRDGDLHRQTFSTRADYLRSETRGLAAGAPWFCDFGPELSRGFRALKVWFALKEHGVKRLGAVIDRNCLLAREFADTLAADPRFELLAPVSLNIVCFRVVFAAAGPEELDQRNAELVVALHERGIAAPSVTRINGRTGIRMHINNYRTQRQDLADTLQGLIAIAEERRL